MERSYSANAIFMFLLLMSFFTYTLPAYYGSVVHDIAIVDVTVYPTKALAGAAITINATVENRGTSYERFNVTVYFDNHTIQTLTVTNLQPAINTTLTFEWWIFPYRLQIFPPPWEGLPWIMTTNCTIKVEANVIPGEVDTFDNVYVNGTVTVFWSYTDLNGDGKINIIDLYIIARVFGFNGWHPCVDPAWDIDQDGVITIREIFVVAIYFGRDYTWLDP